MRFRLLPLAAVVAVLVAACGGSSTPTTTTHHTHKNASSKKVTTSTSAATNTSTSANVSTSSGSGSSSKPTFASVGNCTQLAGVGDQFAKAMSSATSGGKYNLNEVVAAYHDLANAAPSAIRGDIQTLASTFTAYASALQKSGYKFGTVPSASQISAIEGAAKDFDSSKLKTASKDLEKWAAANCK